MTGSLSRWSPGDHRGNAVYSNVKLFLQDNCFKLHQMHVAPSLIKQWELLQRMVVALECVSTPGEDQSLQVDSDVSSESGSSSGVFPATSCSLPLPPFLP